MECVDNKFDLIIRAKNGDIDARNEFIESHFVLVVKIANSFLKNRNLNDELLPDLIQSGYVGLIIAFDNYDVNSNVDFCDYAYMTILHNIYKSMFNNYGFRLDRDSNYKVLRIKEVIANYSLKNNGNNPSFEEISEITGYELEDVKFIINYLRCVSSFSEYTESELDNLLNGDLSLEFELAENKEYLYRIIKEANLTDKELFALNGVYCRGYGISELATMMGVSKQRAFNLHIVAIGKLRNKESEIRCLCELRKLIDTLNLTDMDRKIVTYRLGLNGKVLTRKELGRKFGYSVCDMIDFEKKALINLKHALFEIGERDLAREVLYGRKLFR